MPIGKVHIMHFCLWVMFDNLNFRAELEGIKIKGSGCPKPIKTWAQCGVSKRVMEILKKSNYEKPTPIQAQVSENIYIILSGFLFILF